MSDVFICSGNNVIFSRSHMLHYGDVKRQRRRWEKPSIRHSVCTTILVYIIIICLCIIGINNNNFFHCVLLLIFKYCQLC